MDGYALRAADAPGRLTLIGESAAGRGFSGSCGLGNTVRISTGAALPDGADAVVMQEDVTRDGDVVRVPKVAAGENVRPQGMDFAAGAMLLEAGRKLDGVAVALAAAAGHAHLPVSRQPRVAILTGGDELTESGAIPGPFQIFDSATWGLAALTQSWGGIPRRLALEKDDLAAMARAAQQALAQSDLLVVIGGASVGDHDHARPALASLGLELAVDKIALRPGKPTWFGLVGRQPVLGLPGNPASALVCAHLFLRPILDRLQGRDPVVTLQKARLLHDLPANGPREHYLRSDLSSDDKGQALIRAWEQQDSSLLSVFAAANALIRLPANAPAMAEGALMDVLPLERG
jgi:molybdopterin molybdotransferase